MESVIQPVRCSFEHLLIQALTIYLLILLSRQSSIWRIKLCLGNLTKLIRWHDEEITMKYEANFQRVTGRR